MLEVICRDLKTDGAVWVKLLRITDEGMDLNSQKLKKIDPIYIGFLRIRLSWIGTDEIRDDSDGADLVFVSQKKICKKHKKSKNPENFRKIPKNNRS
jgi:hypothetical protein